MLRPATIVLPIWFVLVLGSCSSSGEQRSPATEPTVQCPFCLGEIPRSDLGHWTHGPRTYRICGACNARMIALPAEEKERAVEGVATYVCSACGLVRTTPRGAPAPYC